MFVQVMESAIVLTTVTAIVTMLEVNVNWWYALERTRAIQRFAVHTVHVTLLIFALVMLHTMDHNAVSMTATELNTATCKYVLVMVLVTLQIHVRVL